MGGGKKGNAPDPPDFTGIVAASEKAAEYARDAAAAQLQWAKDQYAKDRTLIDPVIQQMIKAGNFNQQAAEQDRQRYLSTHVPLVGGLIADANSYNSPARQKLEAGKAMASVHSQFDATREAALRNLEGFGVDPTSTRYGALDIGVRTAEAAAAAGAGNQAAQNTENVGRALRSEAINVTAGLPANSLAASQASQMGRQGAVGSQLGATASGASTMGTPAQYLGLQNQALGGAAGALGAGYNAQLAQYNANQNSSSGFGTALGLLGGFFDEGGDVGIPDGMTPGGPVPYKASPSQGIATDDVPAQLTAGEFVIPKDVKEWKGEEFFHKFIEKARADKQAPKQAQGQPGRMPPQQPRMVSQGIPA